MKPSFRNTTELEQKQIIDFLIYIYLKENNLQDTDDNKIEAYKTAKDYILTIIDVKECYFKIVFALNIYEEKEIEYRKFVIYSNTILELYDNDIELDFEKIKHAKPLI